MGVCIPAAIIMLLRHPADCPAHPLSVQVLGVLPELEACFAAVARLDTAAARARYGRWIEGKKQHQNALACWLGFAGCHNMPLQTCLHMVARMSMLFALAGAGAMQGDLGAKPVKWY
jgi:hypothetical protein